MDNAQTELFVCPYCDSQSYMETVPLVGSLAGVNLLEIRNITCLGCHQEFECRMSDDKP